MRYVVDLHSHSGYAGGVGNISLEEVASTMAKKGIHAFGVGDCLQPEWRRSLERRLEEREEGLFTLREAEGSLASARFVLQTEVIITSPVASGGRKGTHVVLLFPGLAAVDDAIGLLRRWQVKLDIGRPFLKCGDVAEVAEKCAAFRAIDETVMVIPAHVMTPQGIFGSDHPVDSLTEVFGDFAASISTVETGLSSDPAMLATLPELDRMTLISNSDCHSGALNRVGREFTAVEVPRPSYGNIVGALRGGKVLYTAEFNPAEGRYFLTGHKPGLERHGASYCYYSPDRVPGDGKCPICGKPLTLGVLDRLLHLAKVQSRDGKARKLGETKPRQASKTLVPLVEVIAAGLGVKSVSSRKIGGLFEKILAKAGTELELWEIPLPELEPMLAADVPEPVFKAIRAVHSGNFSFQPGFDGMYGILRLGEKIDWYGQESVVVS